MRVCAPAPAPFGCVRVKLMYLRSFPAVHKYRCSEELGSHVRYVEVVSWWYCYLLLTQTKIKQFWRLFSFFLMLSATLHKGTEGAKPGCTAVSMRDECLKGRQQKGWGAFLSHEVMCADNPRYPSAGRTAFYRAQFSALNEICWVSGLLWTMRDAFKGTSGAKELKYKETWWILELLLRSSNLKNK